MSPKEALRLTTAELMLGDGPFARRCQKELADRLMRQHRTLRRLFGPDPRPKLVMAPGMDLASIPVQETPYLPGKMIAWLPDGPRVFDPSHLPKEE